MLRLSRRGRHRRQMKKSIIFARQDEVQTRSCIYRIPLKIKRAPCSFTVELPVTRKLSHRKTARAAMSPLLRSLTYTQVALGPVVGSMLLRC
jgi:hypothetical protein